MAVYVDDMHKTPLGTLGRMKMCHMCADTFEELHAFAEALGLKREWYQGPPKTKHPHYDISLGKRKQALTMGAKEVTMKEIVVIAKNTK